MVIAANPTKDSDYDRKKNDDILANSRISDLFM